MIGAGIAGLSFALSLPFPARVMLVTKGALGESNTRYAQGGIAAAIADSDSPALHLQDTIAAGARLVDVEAARMMVAGGKEAVEWLVANGASFDREDSHFALGKEGAHSRSRVLHAGGDATGAEIERALVARVAARDSLTVHEHATAIELHMDDGRCTGATLAIGTERRCSVASATTVLAMGGAGRLWAVSSNPVGATGDGIALAMAAGATLSDLEFTQFHPTVLDLPGEEPFLISEAVRGEGAWLRNDAGQRFMLSIDDRAELAPRDVVARAIHQQNAAGSRAWLDLRHLDKDLVRLRFPTIARHLGMLGLDLARDLIPVAPATHYFMGGVAASPTGKTSVPGLLAIGEVSCTGVHGANRLASNSLLEGLVFGRMAARALRPADLSVVIGAPVAPTEVPRPESEATARVVLQRRVQATMRNHVSVVRTAGSLEAAIRELEAILDAPELIHDASLEAASTRNIAVVAREISASALNRHESRGGHYRVDFPLSDPRLDGQHQLVTPVPEGIPTRRFGALDEAWSMVTQ
ncbi:MAG TPA: L-aspartate oxidase [Thermomicrobiales bacterium]|nr:L-aspartate oxidase [Thermomicrobiales bacterium]